MFFSKRPIGTWEMVESVIDDALDQFYKMVHDDDELSSFMVGCNTQRLKQMQRDHWEATFTNGFNSSYYERLGRIGAAHANVSLPPHFFVRGYGFLMEALMVRMRRKMSRRSDATQQVLKEIIDIIFQDLSVGIKVYYDVLQDGKRTAGQDVLNHSDEFASRMQQLAGEVQSIASGVDQMDASISNITQNVDETSTFARDASDRADSAADSMRAVTTASEEIGSFLSIITEIADKTKLLAVNAAIEAARAGEAGKGSQSSQMRSASWPKAQRQVPKTWQTRSKKFNAPFQGCVAPSKAYKKVSNMCCQHPTKSQPLFINKVRPPAI